MAESVVVTAWISWSGGVAVTLAVLFWAMLFTQKEEVKRKALVGAVSFTLLSLALAVANVDMLFFG